MTPQPPPNPRTETARELLNRPGFWGAMVAAFGMRAQRSTSDPTQVRSDLEMAQLFATEAPRLYALTGRTSPSSTAEMELRKALERIDEKLAKASNTSTIVCLKEIERIVRDALASKPLPPTVWFCETCKSEVHPETVTSDERHELCNTALSGSTPPPIDDVVDRVARALFEHRNIRGLVWDECFDPATYRAEARVAIAAMPAQSPPPTHADVEEAHEIGKREGRDEAMQELDLATGGDGEYRYCTDHDPERHCPDAEAMKARIVARFEAAAQSPPPIMGEEHREAATRLAETLEVYEFNEQFEADLRLAISAFSAQSPPPADGGEA